jgi:hypothetical protein
MHETHITYGCNPVTHDCWRESMEQRRNSCASSCTPRVISLAITRCRFNTAFTDNKYSDLLVNAVVMGLGSNGIPPCDSIMTLLREHDIQNDGFARPEICDEPDQLVTQRHIQGFPISWSSRMCKRGGVCRRHCKTLLRKHVFPALCIPPLTVERDDGHVLFGTPA